MITRISLAQHYPVLNIESFLSHCKLDYLWKPLVFQKLSNNPRNTYCRFVS